mgnify:FL=1|tara:strand:+ start:935 stop:1474 length:540 start_codon:yes stop_codon:yes gene_type:complete
MDKVINRLINDHVNGADTYRTKDSMWIIFTESKKWVIELTHEGTLWYNFHFFKGIFSYLSLNVIEEQHYITKWVEDTIQNGVRNTRNLDENRSSVEDTIQNGVKETFDQWNENRPSVEDAIQNGFKRTIQNKIKRTYRMKADFLGDVEQVIQNGIKETHDDVYHHKGRVDGVIKIGLKT